MPGRGTELTLRALALPILLSVLATASPVAAQTDREPVAATVPVAALEATVRLTGLHGEALWMPGGLVAIRVAEGFSLGGGGWIGTRKVALDPGTGPGLELAMGYGAAMAAVVIPVRSDRVLVSVRSMIGVGNADVRDRVTGTLVASDNFVVVEPGVTVSTRVAGAFSLLGGASYRAALGVEDLVGVEAGDLSAPSLVVGIRVGAF